MTLHERVRLLLIGFLVLLAVVGVLGSLAIRQRDELAAKELSYDIARDNANDLLSDYVDQETAVRGYLISGNRELLEPYERGRASAEATLDQLRSRLENDPGLLARVERAATAGELWQRRAAETEIVLADEGRRREAADLVATGEGQTMFDDVRAEIMGLRDQITVAQTMTEDQLISARKQLNAVLVATIALGGIMLLIITRALERWANRPLREISAAMRDVTGGELDRRIPAVGPRDFAELGGDAELMRRRIVAELDSARRAEQALRSQGAIVSVLRSELDPTEGELPPSLSMAAGFEPVKGVLAGDWYDVFRLDDSAVVVCLIDVSGHGQATGVFALQAKNLMLAGARLLLEPGAILSWMSQALGDTGDNFLTAFVARIDPQTGSCTWASAGHLPTLLTHAGGVAELGPTGPLLGPLPGTWQTEHIALEPGAVMVAYTDGVTETRGPNNEEFGEERLRAVVAARAHEHPTTIISTCLDAVHDFAADDVNDDLTIVAVRWLPRDRD